MLHVPSATPGWEGDGAGFSPSGGSVRLLPLALLITSTDGNCVFAL